MAPLSRPRASSAGAAARLSLAEMMEVRGGWVAPRGLGSDSVPGGVYGLRGRLERKTRLNFCRAINYGEIARSRRVISYLSAGALHPKLRHHKKRCLQPQRS